MSGISDLILAEGDARARGIASRGQMWGDLVGQSALSFGNVLQSRQAMKAAQAKRAAVQKAFSGEHPPSVADLIAAGIEAPDAMKILADYAKMQPEPVKPQAVETVDDAGNPITQFVTPTAGASYKKPKPVEKKGTREVKTRNADGSESIQIVEDAPGQAFTSAPVPKDGPKVGSEEDFISRFATGLGKPVEQLTDAQIASARRRYASQTHFEAPAAPKSQEWVTRNGQVIPIQPGTAQAGDVPYDQVAARAAKPNNTDDAKAITEDTVGLIDRLYGHAGIDRATGAYELLGWTQDAVDFNDIRGQVVAALTLPNLGALKGPMSDKDVAFIKQISTRLQNPKLSKKETLTALDDARRFLENKLGRRIPKGSLSNQVPPDVASVLGSAPEGRHTLSDGSVWEKTASGAVTRVQ